MLMGGQHSVPCWEWEAPLSSFEAIGVSISCVDSCPSSVLFRRGYARAAAARAWNELAEGASLASGRQCRRTIISDMSRPCKLFNYCV